MTPRPRRVRTSTQPRLGPGELRALVLAHLDAHSGQDFTPAELGNVLHRSRGAIIRACRTLTVTRAAVLTQAAPMRFAAIAGLPDLPTHDTRASSPPT
ncbi:MAG: hypothetical protein QOJ50_3192 [Cryptosporangiaceae bacterium]|nr:hypothetical protein [Cryptosporangiaceae bacterium]